MPPNQRTQSASTSILFQAFLPQKHNLNPCAALSPHTHKQFVTRACAFLDEVITALAEQIKALDEYANCSYKLGRAFQRFCYQSEPAEEGTVSSDLMYSLGAAGRLCTLIKASSDSPIVCLFKPSLNTTTPSFSSPFPHKHRNKSSRQCCTIVPSSAPVSVVTRYDTPSHISLSTFSTGTPPVTAVPTLHRARRPSTSGAWPRAQLSWTCCSSSLCRR